MNQALNHQELNLKNGLSQKTVFSLDDGHSKVYSKNAELEQFTNTVVEELKEKRKCDF